MGHRQPDEHDTKLAAYPLTRLPADPGQRNPWVNPRTSNWSLPVRIIALSFVLATMSACATPVAAQSASDPVASCLADASEPENRRTCIGALSAPCMDEPSGASTAGMVDCLTRERDLWAGQVATLTARLRAQESPTQIEQLNAMLAAHEHWMRAKCHYSASIFEGGSLTRVLASACARNTTAELALDLLERFDEG